jgi:hypothetical protein
MKRFLMVLLISSVTAPIWSQHFSFTKVDFKNIRSVTGKKGSALYYPRLFERYSDNDTTLSREEFRYLYYGFTFQEEYRPYAVSDAENRVSALLVKDTLTVEDFSSIYTSYNEILLLHPFSLRYLLASSIACSRLGKEAEARTFYFKYDGILSTILSSGDGATEQSAWSVILLSDEYELIRSLGFNPSGKQKMLSESRCDFIYVSANEYGIEGFYFDISRPFSRGFE